MGGGKKEIEDRDTIRCKTKTNGTWGGEVKPNRSGGKSITSNR